MKEIIWGLLTAVLVAVLIVVAQGLTENLHRDSAFIVAFIFGAFTSTIVDAISYKILTGK
jgi:uncharacterized membrane protein YvlD (DUF360 family)